MQGKIHFGALVECREGQEIGLVKYIIDDPQTGHTTHLAIDKGKAETPPKMVACSEIAYISDDNKVIRLGITTKQFDTLPDFFEEDYTCAPGPFGCPSQPFYHNQGPHRLPQGTVYVYPLSASSRIASSKKGETIHEPVVEEQNIKNPVDIFDPDLAPWNSGNTNPGL
jgi:hypothetical protein